MSKCKSGRKVRVSRTGTRLVWTALAVMSALLCSCSTSQKIIVKQEQNGQTQETTIEQSGKVDNLSLSFINTNYPLF